MKHTSPVQYRFFYPALMGLCAALQYIPASTGRMTHPLPAGALCFTGVFSGYYLASLKPAIRLPRLQYNLTLSGTPYYFIFLLPVVLLLIQLPVLQASFQFFLAGLLTLGYYLKWETGRGLFGGLRSIPFVKNITLALAWALTTVPVLTEDSTLLFVHRFFYLLSLSIIIDLRDVEQDRHASVRTLPMYFNLFSTRLLSVCFLLAAGIAGFLFCLKTNQQNVWMAWLCSMVLTGISFLLIRPVDNRQTFLLHVDGNLLLYSILTYSFLRF